MSEKWVGVRIPIYVTQGESGLFFAKCPLIKGLLVSERTEKEAIDAVAGAVDALGLAACDYADDGQSVEKTGD